MSDQKKDKWLKLLGEVEELTYQKEELRKGYIDLVVKKNNITNKSRIKSVVILLLLVVVVSVAVSYNKFRENDKNPLEVQKALSTNFDEDSDKESPEHSNALDDEEDIEVSGETESVVYAVQVGAFRKLNIKNKFNKSSNFKTSKNKDGLNIYSVGEFDNYEAAEEFMKEIKKLGFKDAFVIKLVNKKKVPFNSDM